MDLQSRKSSYLPTTNPPSFNNADGDTSNSVENSPSKSNKRLAEKAAYSRFWTGVKGFFLVVFVLGNLMISSWVVLEHGNLPEIMPGQEELDRKVLEARKCHLPEMQAWSPEIKAVMRDPNRIDCAAGANVDFPNRIFFRTDRDSNLIRIADPKIPCCYRPFYRVNDDEVWLEPTKGRKYVCHNITQEVTPISPKYEFIEVICDNNRKTYHDAFAFAPPKQEVKEKVHRVIESLKKLDPYGQEVPKLNVLIIGIASTSQLSFTRKMTRSVDYILNELGGIRLNGYGKVGDYTLPNLVALLTGMSFGEFKETCVMKNPPMEQAIHLDKCPIIWKHFEKNGYVTSFAEDSLSGIFNLDYSHAFESQPTDYYLRPYNTRAITSHNTHDGFCHGPRMSFQALLDYVEKTSKSVFDMHSFQLAWSSKLTFDNYNRLGWADIHLVKTLKFLKENGNLNSTAVFLISDHGSRKEELLQTRQGQLEDRLPLAYVILPPWFAKRYPQATTNLISNSEKITSPYDIYETLKDLVHLRNLEDSHVQYIRQRRLKVAEKKEFRKGTSLFTMLPEHRGCATAGIPPIWCICYKKKKISTKSLDVHDATGFALRNINAMIRPYSQICSVLRRDKIISALKWYPQDESESVNVEETYKKSTLLEITFTVSPGGAEFQVTVLFEPDHGWKFTEHVVRRDANEETSECMPKKELKKFCVCTALNDPTLDELDTGHDFPVF